jgi:hypothetical protein
MKWSGQNDSKENQSGKFGVLVPKPEHAIAREALTVSQSPDSEAYFTELLFAERKKGYAGLSAVSIATRIELN